MPLDPEPVPPDDALEVDRKTLRLRLDEFRIEHLNRLDALRTDLTADQRLILDAMPLLLHSKHAALPGYVDADTPRGIDNYRPDATARRAVRQIALSYTEPRFVKRDSQLLGLFLSRPHRLGTGSDAHSPDDPAASRMRFRVFCGTRQHPALAEKTRRIQRWAETRDVLIEIELMDPASWREAGAIDTPNLDLDAFYANAIHLAGRFPLWWLVPLNQHGDHQAYCKRLVQQRFVKATDFFDLGDIAEIPSGEIFRASLKELGAALEDPWQSLPRLLLLEAYAAAPTADPLSRHYKAWVTGQREAPSSSPAPSGSILPSSAPADLSGPLLTRFLKAYLKPRHQLQRLSLCHLPSCLTIEQRIELGRDLTAELHQALGHLRSLSSSCDANSLGDRSATDAELKKLAALELKIGELGTTRPAGLPVILPALRRIRTSGYLKLIKSAQTWTLAGEESTIFQAPRLTAVAAWAVLQDLGAERLTCTDVATRSALARMMERLALFFHPAVPSATSDQCRLQVFVNTEEEGLDGLTEQGDALLTDWNDALDFSGFHHILVHSFDFVRQDQHGHVFTRSLIAKELEDGLLGQALSYLYDPELNDIQLHTVGNLKRHQIDIRLRQLILDVRTALEPGSGKKFILALGSGYLCCTVSETSALETQVLKDEPALFSLLGQSNSATSILIDPNSSRLDPVAQAMGLAVAGRVTLMIQASGVESDIYLVEENGALSRFVCSTKVFSATGLIDDLARFLDDQDLQDHPKPRIFLQQEHRLIEYPTLHPLSNQAKPGPKNRSERHTRIPMGRLLAEYLERSFSHFPGLNQRSQS